MPPGAGCYSRWSTAQPLRGTGRRVSADFVRSFSRSRLVTGGPVGTFELEKAYDIFIVQACQISTGTSGETDMDTERHCVHCGSGLHDLHAVDTQGLDGIEYAQAATCGDCGGITLIRLEGSEAAVALARAVLETPPLSRPARPAAS